jgi:3D (Asp-Asp-Asp) domain-containing protein
MADRTKYVEPRRFTVVRSGPRGQAKDTIRGGARRTLDRTRPGLGVGRRRGGPGELTPPRRQLVAGAHTSCTARPLCNRHALARCAAPSVCVAGRVCTPPQRTEPSRTAGGCDDEDTRKLAKHTGRRSTHALQAGRRERIRGGAGRAVARRRRVASRRADDRRRREQADRPGRDRGAAAAAAAPSAPQPVSDTSAPPVPAPPVTVGARTITVSATGYSILGRTATGLPTGWGVVAVDPSVIPLGTRMTIPGYGEGVAADTGGNVRGNTIDLWFPTPGQAGAWGRRTVTVTLH